MSGNDEEKKKYLNTDERAVNAAFNTRSTTIISNDVEENVIQVQPRDKVLLGRATLVEKPQPKQELDNGKENLTQEPRMATALPNPIAIARIENDKLMVDDDALYQLLTGDDVKERPLIIVSIAGAFRTGKSFLLNFLILYLRKQGWENPNWLGDDDSKIRGCNQYESSDFYFPWKRGVKGCTKGVLVCPEVFQIPLKDGRNAAVILVDTQGLHDKMLTADSEARLMSVSMIFGSRQIINIMRQIESTHFTDIELWCHLAAASAGLSSEKKSKIFQDLTILIRDYEHGEYAFGDSKGSYLSSEMRGPSMPPELQETCEALTNAFNEVGCFLMPHPGKKVTSRNNSGLKNSDVDEEFLCTIKQFVESVFDQDNLTVKTSNGHEANSLDVLDLLGRLGQAYKNGYAPTVQTVMQSAVNATNTTALREAILEYRKHMEKMCPDAHDKILTAEEMTNANEEAIRLAEVCFKRYATLGSDEDKEEFFTQCKRECENREFIGFKNKNEFKKERTLNKCWTEFHERRNAYSKIIRQVGSGVTLREFDDKHEQTKEEILKKFDDEIEDFKIVVPDVLNWRKQLVDEIEFIYDLLKNARERMLAVVPCCEKENSLERCMLEIIVKFQNKADEFNQGYYSDIVEEKLTELRDELLKEFETNVIGEISDEIVRVDLELELDIILCKAVWLNNDKKNMLKKTFVNSGKEFAEILLQNIEEVILQGHIEKQCFENYVGEFLLRIMIPSLEREGIPGWGKDIIVKTVKARGAEFEKENRKNGKFRSVFITELTALEQLLEKLTESVRSFFSKWRKG